MSGVARRAWSSALGEHISYRVHVVGDLPRHAAYLWHGRGGNAGDWDRVVPGVTALVEARLVPPLLLVAPEAPWSDGASWYVDSSFTGDPPGRPVETALVRDLVTAVEAAYDVVAARTHRLVAGTSMGAVGALRHLLAHPDVFAVCIALAPPAWHPAPPADSSARAFGAFGVGAERYVDERYCALEPATPGLLDPSLPVRVRLAVGADDELHDVTVALHARLLAGGLPATLTALPGGHDWDVWEPAFVSALPQMMTVPIDMVAP